MKLTDHFNPQPGAASGRRLADCLASLPSELSDALEAISRLQVLERGSLLIAEGSQSGQIGYVLDGTLAMRKMLEDGREHIIGLLMPCDIFGRLFDGPCAYDVVALTDVRLVEFERGAFEDLLGEAPEIERLFLVNLLDELEAAREWILMLSGQKVIERVASFLLVMLRRHCRPGQKTGDREPVLPLPLRRTDLAHYLGTRPETLSRALHELEDRGAVRILDPYLIEIADRAALVEIAGPDLLFDAEG